MIVIGHLLLRLTQTARLALTKREIESIYAYHLDPRRYQLRKHTSELTTLFGR